MRFIGICLPVGAGRTMWTSCLRAAFVAFPVTTTFTAIGGPGAAAVGTAAGGSSRRLTGTVAITPGNAAIHLATTGRMLVAPVVINPMPGKVHILVVPVGIGTVPAGGAATMMTATATAAWVATATTAGSTAARITTAATAAGATAARVTASTATASAATGVTTSAATAAGATAAGVTAATATAGATTGVTTSAATAAGATAARLAATTATNTTTATGLTSSAATAITWIPPTAAALPSRRRSIVHICRERASPTTRGTTRGSLSGSSLRATWRGVSCAATCATLAATGCDIAGAGGASMRAASVSSGRVPCAWAATVMCTGGVWATPCPPGSPGHVRASTLSSLHIARSILNVEPGEELGYVIHLLLQGQQLCPDTRAITLLTAHLGFYAAPPGIQGRHV